MDTSVLNDVSFVKNKILAGSLQTQEGVGKTIRNRDIESILMLGEPMVLSSWWILLQRRLLYRNKKVFLWSHGWYGKEGFLKKWLKRAFFGMADHVFTYGEYAKRIAISQGFNGEKITPIHNSLNHQEQVRLRKELSPSDTYVNHFNNKLPVIIFIGRLTPVKRLDLLLEALALLKNKGIHYNLTLIGGGEEMENLKKQTESLNLTNQVWFYGPCYDDSQNAQLIYDASVCVAPGNVGLTAMHSMVFGTPVITHNDFPWQMPEFEAIIEGQTGTFFKKGDVSDMADTVKRWLEGHTDRDEVRRTCYNEIDSRWSPEYQIAILKTKIN